MPGNMSHMVARLWPRDGYERSSANLAGGNPGGSLELTEVADMLGLRGKAGHVDGEAHLGSLEVLDDVLSERLEITDAGGVTEGLEGIVGSLARIHINEPTRHSQSTNHLKWEQI